jgi:hypothetical protein
MRAVPAVEKVRAGYFLSDLERSWQQHGREALYRLATERPLAFFRVMIKLAQLLPLEPGPLEESGWPCNREEVLQRLETRVGQTGKPPRARSSMLVRGTPTTPIG